MGKIDSGEIGEVDPHTDSANSLLLIKYATESQSICFLPQREEAAENVRKKCIAPSLRPQASFGHLKVFRDLFFECVLFVWIIICFNIKGYSCRELPEWSADEKFWACL